MYHEVHNEFEPVPTQLANMISQWIDAHIDGPIGSTNETVPGLHDQSRVGASGSPVDGAVGSSKL